MRDQEIVGLWESYLEVCDTQQLDEISKELAGRVVNARIAKTGAAFDREMKDRTPENMRDTMDAAGKEGRAKRLAAGVRTRRNTTKEDVDIFDTILEHLVDEGYADTNESAIAIMANMSEEWREDILNELDEGYKPLPKDRIKNKAKKLAKDTLGDVGTTLNPFKSDYEKDVAKHNMRKREKRVNKMVDALKTLKTQK